MCGWDRFVYIVGEDRPDPSATWWTKMKMHVRTLLSFLMVTCLMVDRSESLTFRIYHGREECVGVRLPADAIEALTEGAERREDRNAQINVLASGGFIVKNAYGAEVDKGVVNVKLVDPLSKVVYTQEQASEGDFDIKAPIPVANSDGPWQFCFIIAKGEGIMKYKSSLLFELSFLTLELEKMPGKVFGKLEKPSSSELAAQAKLPEVEKLAQTDHFTELMQSIRRLKLSVYRIMQEQRFLMQRDARHRVTVEATFARSLRWSLMEAAMILLAAFAQVKILTHLFQKKNAAVGIHGRA